MKSAYRFSTLCLLLFSFAVLCSGCGQRAEKRKPREIIEELVVDYGSYGAEAETHIQSLLSQLRAADADAADRWERILALWKTANTELTVHDRVLPDGLPDTDTLCIVALGFQLEPDGTMRGELVERLKVVKESAEKYPRALIVCTGGGTAAQDETATEAGRMAEWLIENGIAEERILVRTDPSPRRRTPSTPMTF